MITFRIDVDYPYNNRLKSFISVFFNSKLGNGYLDNAKIIAKMINNSEKNTKAFWFFTYATIPDREMIELLQNEKHELCLHAVKDVHNEQKLLEEKLGTKILFFNKHGVRRILTKIIWHKFGDLKENGNGIKYFSGSGCLKFDKLCLYRKDEVFKIADKFILHIHPDWLYNTSKLSYHCRYFEDLKKMLGCD